MLLRSIQERPARERKVRMPALFAAVAMAAGGVTLIWIGTGPNGILRGHDSESVIGLILLLLCVPAGVVIGLWRGWWLHGYSPRRSNEHWHHNASNQAMQRTAPRSHA